MTIIPYFDRVIKDHFALSTLGSFVYTVLTNLWTDTDDNINFIAVLMFH